MNSTKLNFSYILERLRYLINDSETDAARFLLATGSLLWGTLLLLPGNTFERPMFILIKQVATENTWAALFLIHGIVAMMSIIRNNKTCITFILDGIGGCLLWTSILIGMVLSSFESYHGIMLSVPAAISPAAVITISAWWLLYRYPIMGIHNPIFCVKSIFSSRGI